MHIYNSAPANRVAGSLVGEARAALFRIFIKPHSNLFFAG
ncbi:hypothetical protein SAMN05443144_10142 [Fodinibius roseus]|uniref:Uncharacterized protein n=1 Tax=Fodinibius roseus TaxID=1194090 RepID=A0A1M4SI48_9BACT|nr:hypothetical protein SAMN05443144_10142 [Fodinibius roseus]